MPAVKKNKSKAQNRSLFGKPVRSRIDKNMPDFENDPVFVKRAEEAARFIEKHGLAEKIDEIVKNRK
jgi:hypothetical protein